MERKRGRIRRDVTGKEATDYIRAKLHIFQETGGTSITTESLEQLLEHLDSGRPDRDIGLILAAEKERATAKYGARVNFHLELFKSVIESGHAALRSLFLLNGGAAVAVLALVGHLSTSATTAPHVNKFACPLLWFAVGLALAATASGFTYLVQRAFAARKGRRGRRLNGITVCLCIGSIVAFAVGSAVAYAAIQAIATSQANN